MKKALLLVIFLAAGMKSVLPCDVYMETAPVAGNARNKVQVKLFVEFIHKRCPVKIEETRLDPKNVSIEKQGEWKKIAVCTYEKDLVVVLSGKGPNEIRVLRECPKTGLQEEVLGIVRL
ncbi:MAG: hypothetical protein MUC72_09675 [Acidobacteria bacterium]|nr:hypothetical protein [Acidobacteriota bacterium]